MGLSPLTISSSQIVTTTVDASRWIEFVGTCPQAGPFHHPAWAQLLADCYGYRAFALTLTESGRITAGLPIIAVHTPVKGERWISLPFTDCCPPLAVTLSAQAQLTAGLDPARRAGGARAVEVRGELPAPGVQLRTDAVIHTLRLEPNPQEVFRTFHRSQVQRNIGKAERSGLTVRRAERQSDLTEIFYNLHLRTRRRQGTPVQPRRFFALLWQRMVEPGLGSVLLAYAGDVPVAGAVFLHWNNHVVYKYGASDPSFWKLRPNHLIFWQAIRTACENGCHTLDFGRTDLANQGLRDFKSGWGAHEEPLVYSCIADSATPRSGVAGDAHLLLGAAIRHSPVWVCRLLGELLYRYAA